MGSGVCDHHPNLGIACLPLHHPQHLNIANHWRGLRFEWGEYTKELTEDNIQYTRVSRSVLSHVVVEHAGQGRVKNMNNATSGIESIGVPPVMEYVTVHNSAYNGQYWKAFTLFIDKLTLVNIAPSLKIYELYVCEIRLTLT